MILYHGSSEVIQIPKYGKGSANNDYGRGFYCTEDIDLAKEWACLTTKGGFANKYTLDMSDLSVLKLTMPDYHILNWIAILIQNRTFEKRTPIMKQAANYVLNEFLPDISGFDIVCGYRADDSYFSYAKDFLNNTISVNQLAEAMRLGNLGEQVVLKSEKAFQQIQFIGYEIADGVIYSEKRNRRDDQARNAYLKNHGLDFSLASDDIFVRDIIQQGVKNDDPRLF